MPPLQGHLSLLNIIITLSNALIYILLPDLMYLILSSNAVKITLIILWPKAFSKLYYLPKFYLYFSSFIYYNIIPA